MKEAQVQPDKLLYTTLIASYSAAGELERAQQLIPEMKVCSSATAVLVAGCYWYWRTAATTVAAAIAAAIVTTCYCCWYYSTSAVGTAAPVPTRAN